MLKPTLNVFWVDCLQGFGEGGVQQGAGASRTPAQERFDLRPAGFDGREVRGIGGQKDDFPAGAAHCLFDVGGSMHLQVVEEDNRHYPKEAKMSGCLYTNG